MNTKDLPKKGCELVMNIRRGREKEESGFNWDGAPGSGATNLRGCNQQLLAPGRNIQMSTAASIEKISRGHHTENQI